MREIPPREPGHFWGVVFDGGLGGRRRRWARGARDRLLDQPLERAAWTVPADRLVRVITRNHGPRDCREPDGVGRVQTIVQPAWRGSAPALFLAILRIAGVDPEATVVVLPAGEPRDAGTPPARSLACAAQAVALRADLAVVLGAAPRGPDATHAWIEPGGLVDGLEAHGLRAVRRFVARPSGDEAARLCKSDGLLNTSVVIAKARTIVARGRRRLPDVLEAFEPLVAAVSTPEEPLLREAVYEGMPYASMEHALFVAGADVAVLPVPRLSVPTEESVRHTLAP